MISESVVPSRIRSPFHHSPSMPWSVGDLWLWRVKNTGIEARRQMSMVVRAFWRIGSAIE
uniref:Uncharacterized protein n=1 Tax=Arabidopsis thaliana TaxID=3702 RepID=Q8GX64_ARATH|nr:unknown protein [Arabidopsis thaliana]